MKHLFEDWDSLKEKFINRRFFLFLDYDGTLTPIVETPEQAILPTETKMLLQQLTRIPRCHVAVVSGRELNDIKDRVGISDIIYVGNHGFEIDGPNIHFDGFSKENISVVLSDIRAILIQELAKIDGVIIEDKSWSLSVHYRLVNENDLALFNSIFSQACKPYLAEKQIKVYTGKKVFEVRPPIEWGKGTVVEWLLNKLCTATTARECPAVYIGDDQTDEDAFEVLKKEGIGIRVGAAQTSAANYFLEDPAEVNVFFRKLAELKKDQCG